MLSTTLRSSPEVLGAAGGREQAAAVGYSVRAANPNAMEKVAGLSVPAAAQALALAGQRGATWGEAEPVVAPTDGSAAVASLVLRARHPLDPLYMESAEGGGNSVSGSQWFKHLS